MNFRGLANSNLFLMDKEAFVGRAVRGAANLGRKAFKGSQKRWGKFKGPAGLAVGGLGMAAVGREAAGKSKQWQQGFKASRRTPGAIG